MMRTIPVGESLSSPTLNSGGFISNKPQTSSANISQPEGTRFASTGAALELLTGATLLRFISHPPNFSDGSSLRQLIRKRLHLV